MPLPQGIVFYNGPSEIDGKPIIAVATGFKSKSDNPKTGPVIQTYILPKHAIPTQCRKDGTITSVCGDCKMQKLKMCYTNMKHGSNQIFKSWKNGRYEKLSMHNYLNFWHKTVRMGSMGDPAAVPIEVWEKIMKIAGSVVGYSHQWRRCHQKLQQWCMASVDTTKEQREAQRMGWRTFRIRLPQESIQKNEFMCPASNEAGNKTTCNKCLGCGGHGSKAKRNVCIVVHGEKYKVKRFYRFKKVRVPV